MRDVRMTVLGRWRARWTDSTGRTRAIAFDTPGQALQFLDVMVGSPPHPTHTLRCTACGCMSTYVITDETIKAGLPPPPGWGTFPLVCPQCRHGVAQEVVA